MLPHATDIAQAIRAGGGHATLWLEDGAGIRRVPIEAPWAWLAAGWRDLWAIPSLSLVYGGVFTITMYTLSFLLFRLGWLPALPALAGGLLLIGPMLAVGLYEASRRIESGQEIDARDIVIVGVRSPGQLLLMGAFLLGLFLVWLELALLLLMLFTGDRPLPPAGQFAASLLFTPRGLGLLVTGTIVGFAIAVVVFAATAVAIPLLLARDIDLVTAVRVSLAAVRRNQAALGLWAALIAALMTLGLVTLGIGLVIIFPLLGHATWHAFRDLVELKVEPAIVPDVLTR